MRKNYFLAITIFIIWLIPFAYLIYSYPSMPQTVAIHFNIDGHADKYGNKTEMLWGVCFMSALSIGIFFLLKYLPKIDPKKNARNSENIFKKIAFAVIILFAVINLCIINSAVTGSFLYTKFYLPGISLFFVFIGNLMYSIKPNYFAGIRTPWALENEDNWRATHQLASKLFFAGGIIMAIATLLLPFKPGFIFFITCTIIITLVPCIYSYQFYKKHKQS